LQTAEKLHCFLGITGYFSQAIFISFSQACSLL